MKVQSLFPRFVIAQVIIAIIAVAVTLATVFKVSSLIETKGKLEAEIKSKLDRVRELEVRIEDAQKELVKKQKMLESGKLLTESILQGSGLIKGGSSAISELPQQEEGYVVVLGSYKSIEKAISAVKRLRQTYMGEVKLYFAVNDYYAAVLGIFSDKETAEVQLERARETVSDAYIFRASAFPYEIKLELPSPPKRTRSPGKTDGPQSWGKGEYSFPRLHN
jgi:hypothetical protein